MRRLPNAGFAPILCSFNQALAGEVWTDPGLLKFTLKALESTGEGTVRTGAYAVWAVRETHAGARSVTSRPRLR
jgi:hypothetical protein